MTILTTTRISKGFRTTIPKKVRDLLELEEGNELGFFIVEGQRGRVCFRKASGKQRYGLS